MFFFFKQKTAYEMRISDWSSDVCSSDPHRGMVGGAIKRYLENTGYTNLLLRTSEALDLRNQQAVNDFFAMERPEYVFLAAAKVGGIMANNTYRADFIYDNLIMATNIIHAAYQRSEEHTSELQSLMRTSYADFCLQK